MCKHSNAPVTIWSSSLASRACSAFFLHNNNNTSPPPETALPMRLSPAALPPTITSKTNGKNSDLQSKLPPHTFFEAYGSLQTSYGGTIRHKVCPTQHGMEQKKKEKQVTPRKAPSASASTSAPTMKNRKANGWHTIRSPSNPFVTTAAVVPDEAHTTPLCSYRRRSRTRPSGTGPAPPAALEAGLERSKLASTRYRGVP